MQLIVLQKPEYATYPSVRRVEGFGPIKAEYAAYLSDESKMTATSLDWIFFPKDEAELAAVVCEMSAENIPVTIAGSRTGLVGGSVPAAGALISMEHFDRIEAIYFDEPTAEWRVRLQANVSLKTLQTALNFKHFPDIENSREVAGGSDLQRFKKDPCQYFYPPDPTEMSASIGGTVATNASGARTYRFGPTRAWIRGLRALLMNGEILEIPRGKYFASPEGKFVLADSSGRQFTLQIPTYTLPETKNAAGFYTAPQMDLIDLFIGSEGVLGIITQVDVALLKQEAKLSMVQFLDSDEQAIRLTMALRSNSAIQLDFLEFYSGKALDLLREKQKVEPAQVSTPAIPDAAGAALFFELNFTDRDNSKELSSLQETLHACGAEMANSWVAYEPREMERLKAFRHLLPETVNGIIAERKRICPGLHKLGTDLSVPDECLPAMWELYHTACTASGLEWLAFGHIGNNHLHINILPHNESEIASGLALYARFAQQAVDFGGSVSAEHGIGKLKKKFFHLMYRPDQIAQMEKVKTALDPLNLLNRGTLFEVQELP